MMMQYSTLLLIILLIILIVIVLKKITLNIEMRKYFDGANNINFQLQGLRYEGFSSNNKDKNSFFGEVPRLLIETVLVAGIASLIVILSLVNQDFNEIIVILTFTVALILRAIPSVTRIIYQSGGLYFKIDTINSESDIKSLKI